MDFKYVSARGDILHLVDNPNFVLVNIDGHTSISTSISSAVIGGIDGDTVNNVQAQPRTIVLDFRIKSGVNVEAAKREILKIIKPKQYGALIWEQNEKTVTISGIVESIDMPRWNNAVVMQVALHCEQPYWEDINAIIGEISEAIDLHYFTADPFDMLYFPEDGIAFGEYDTIRTKAFYNAGDVSVGLEITIVALDTVTNPIIYDQNGNFFGVGYEYETESGGAGIGTAWVSNPLVMQAGDNVVITTHKGRKTVTLNGTPVFDKIKPGSTWLQLAAGDNQFAVNSDDESTNNMAFSLVYKQRYV